MFFQWFCFIILQIYRPALTGKFSLTAEAKTIYMNNFKTDPETSKNTNIPMNF